MTETWSTPRIAPPKQHRKWRNQYIALVEQRADRILPFTQASFNDDARVLLDELSRNPDTIIEIGSGSGAHLIEQARRSPNLHFYGLELRFKRIYRTVEKLDQLAIRNVRMLKLDANFLPSLLPQRSLAGVYVNFPDPWDHRKWVKHRLMRTEFIDQVAGWLKPDGFLSFKTDHAEYFAEVRSIVSQHASFVIEKLSDDLHSGPYAAESVRSEFERLFESKKQPVGYLHARRYVTR